MQRLQLQLRVELYVAVHLVLIGMLFEQALSLYAGT